MEWYEEKIQQQNENKKILLNRMHRQYKHENVIQEPWKRTRSSKMNPNKIVSEMKTYVTKPKRKKKSKSK